MPSAPMIFIPTFVDWLAGSHVPPSVNDHSVRFEC